MTTPTSEPGGYPQELSGTPPAIAGVATSVAAFVGRTLTGPVAVPTRISNWSDYRQSFGNLSSDSALSYQVSAFFENGGSDALVVRLCRGGQGEDPFPLAPADYLGDQAARTGLHALDATDFNILCIPPDLDGTDLPLEVCQAAAGYCAARGAMLIVDPPVAWQASFDAHRLGDLTPDWFRFGPEAARSAALYFPRVLLADPLRNGAIRSFPVSGTIAGIWASTDLARGVWKAPAGTDAALAVAGLAALLDDGQNGLLNPEGINCLRHFPVYGNVVWGARTMRGADALEDAYKYVPVRRLAQYITASVRNGLQWAVFEPNGPALWSQVRLLVDAFMSQLWLEGALFGSTANTAFFVTCDQSTTTPEDIDNGFFNVLIGFAPAKPAEFVVISLQQMAAQPSS